MDRTIIVTVPDNDAAEVAVRRVASQLRDGFNILTIPLPPALGMQHSGAVAQIVAEAQAKLNVVAAVAARQN